MLCEEPERPVGAVCDADAGRDFDGFGDQAGVVDGEGVGGVEDGQAVLRAGDAEGAREAPGAGDAFDGADEDAAGGAVGFGDEIEALVDAVDEIDVGAAGRAEDDLGAGGDAAGGVGGFVIEAEVGFGFDDGGGVGAADEEFAEEIAGDGDGVAGVEGFRERRVGCCGAQWVD